VLVAFGRVSQGSAALDLAAQLAEEQHSHLRTQLAWSRAGFLLLGGRWREADELSRATYDLHARMKGGTAQFNRMAQRWEAAYLTGSGSDLVDELRAVAEPAGPPALHSLLVMALIEAGQVHDARAALRQLPYGHKDYLWLYTHCWALLAASRLGETGLATRLRAQLLPYRHAACSVLDLAMSGSVAYFTAEAALALGDPDSALADLAIATDMTERMDAQPWLAQVGGAIKRAQQLKADRHPVDTSEDEKADYDPAGPGPPYSSPKLSPSP
jgi:hypothetical protein